MMMLGGKKEIGRGEMWVDKVEVEQESRAESV